jgi:hypothetical protein
VPSKRVKLAERTHGQEARPVSRKLLVASLIERPRFGRPGLDVVLEASAARPTPGAQSFDLCRFGPVARRDLKNDGPPIPNRQHVVATWERGLDPVTRRAGRSTTTRTSLRDQQRSFWTVLRYSANS